MPSTERNGSLYYVLQIKRNSILDESSCSKITVKLQKRYKKLHVNVEQDLLLTD